MRPQHRRIQSVARAAAGLTQWANYEHTEAQRKRIFLLKIAKALYEYGCPIKRLESTVELAAASLNLRGDVAVVPGLLIASFDDPETQESQTTSMRMVRGLDVYRLQQTEKLIKAVIHKNEISMDELNEELNLLDAIASPKFNAFPKWIKVGCYGLFSFASLAAFPGNWRDGIISFMFGLILVGGALEFQTFKNFAGPLVEFTIAAIVSFIAQVFATIPMTTPFCYWSIAMCCTCWLLPGLSITTATMELSNGNLISGTVNMFYALVLALMLGFGLAFGSTAVFWVTPSNFQSTCKREFSSWWELILFPMFEFTMYVLLNASVRQWPAMFTTSTLAYLTYKIAAFVQFSSAVSTVMSSFVAHIVAHILHQVFGSELVPSILVGIMMLLPGGLSVRGAELILLQSNYGDASSFGYQMLQIAMSIAVGIFAAAPFVRCIKCKRRKQKVLTRRLSNQQTW
eukprot:TRINITY_DN10826_c0_g3_i1.p1 TRINITY_DN10826_c0_g3~~TRINITY_DN10826_c0_g3_i1.p1  ORF type:complete len:527 (+),score=114.72 TRINITY_DN10826_c0_g3_i1:211-1581(+)